MSESAGLWGMFLSAFTSATLLPGTSEAIMLGLLGSQYSFWGVICVATVGNVLGSITNYLIGLYGNQWLITKVIGADRSRLEKSERIYQRFGYLSLFFSWMPVIGDPLTVFAGIFRLPFFLFLAIVTISKFGRYFVLGYGFIYFYK
jgi:membrane protein YqaA with SNARE-associated domain